MGYLDKEKRKLYLKEYAKKHRKKLNTLNRERYYEKAKIRRIKKKDEINKKRREFVSKNIEKFREAWRKQGQKPNRMISKNLYDKKRVSELHNSYLKQFFNNSLTQNEVLLEVKKIHLQLKRKLKEIKDGNK